MSKLNPFKRLIRLLELLYLLAISGEFESFSTIGFTHTVNHTDAEKMDKIYTYILDNFKKELRLEEVSSIANMTTNSFCRYFKAHTKKTFSNFLAEVRIGHVCKLLLENNKTVSQICYLSGFRNVSNFNRQFKTVTVISPVQYHEQFFSGKPD